MLSSNAQIHDLLNPSDADLGNLTLIDIPYPGAFANAKQLREILRQYTENIEVAPLSISSEAEHFYSQIFNHAQTHSPLELWVNRRTYDQYQYWRSSNPDLAREFFDCFVKMQSLNRLQESPKGLKGEYHFFKRRRTVERPVYYTKPNAIHLAHKKAIEQVIVVDLCIEQGNGQYKPTPDEVLANMDPKPYKPLSALHGHQKALIVSLGKSPMIVTQLYMLLNQFTNDGRGSIPTIALIYPGANGDISNSATLLKQIFEQKKVKVYTCPVKGIKDIDSRLACESYSHMLAKVVKQIKVKHPEQVPTLSLAGGRKGMSLLTFFVAQRMGLDHIYHTVISDPELEERVMKETSYDALRSVSNSEKKRRLFLDAYEIENFSLLRIPVIPLSRPLAKQ